MKITSIMLLISVTIGVFIDGYHCKLVQFIFGDSLSDVGNNNYLYKSIAKANLPWYGIDFEKGLPNGRFTNGRTVADIVGDQMGLPRPPAFLDPSLTEDVILSSGVNYASGGGGILNETGSLFIQTLSLNRQIELFKGTQELIKEKMGEEAAATFFQQSRYIVAIGSNDFINNYLMPLIYNDSRVYTDQTFITYLTQTLETQLTQLHSLGARQVMLFGLAPIGCIPLQRVLGSSGQCQDRPNKLSMAFNQAAIKLLDNLNTRLSNASFEFGDSYQVVNDVITNPKKYGFSNSDSPCCSFGTIRPALTCMPASKLCKDRSKYVFWDEYHPSDRANQLIANELIKKLGFLRVNGTNPSPVPATAPTSK